MRTHTLTETLARQTDHPAWCEDGHLTIHDHARSRLFDLDDGTGYLVVTLRKKTENDCGPAWVHISLHDDDEHGSHERETVNLTDVQAAKVARIMIRSFGEDPFLLDILEAAEAGIAADRERAA